MPVYKYQTKRGIRYYVKYRNITKRGFESSRQAKLYESKLRLNDINNYNIEDIYFNVLANKYLQRKEKDVTYATYIKWNNIIKNIILPNIENKKISMINEKDCILFRDYIDSLNYMTSYKNTILSQYKAIFNYAVKYFGLSHNPSIIIKPFRLTFNEKQKKKNEELNVWNIDEFSKFISCVDSEMYRCLFSILYYTGMRIGELQALQWKDIYNGKVHITKSLTKHTKKDRFEIKEPKNDSSMRNIDLGISLEKSIYSYKEKEMTIYGFNENWYIFGRNEPIMYSSIQCYLNKKIKQANVKKITLHDFRHSHASNLIANGINIVSISKRLGHSNINTTTRIYIHLIDKIDLELVKYIDTSFQKVLKD